MLESAGSLDFQVNATPSAGAPDMVTVTICGFHGADPMDFNISNSRIQSLIFDMINDNVLGDNQTFEVTLSSFDPNVMINSPSTATVCVVKVCLFFLLAGVLSETAIEFTYLGIRLGLANFSGLFCRLRLTGK